MKRLKNFLTMQVIGTVVVAISWFYTTTGEWLIIFSVNTATMTVLIGFLHSTELLERQLVILEKIFDRNAAMRRLSSQEG